MRARAILCCVPVDEAVKIRRTAEHHGTRESVREPLGQAHSDASAMREADAGDAVRPHTLPVAGDLDEPETSSTSPPQNSIAPSEPSPRYSEAKIATPRLRERASSMSRSAPDP